MIRARIIPCLLLKGHGLVKTKKFKDPVYIGDPINAIRVFNEKEVDELIILDIDASKNPGYPNFELIAEIAGECFMPLAYGGGINSIEQVRRLIRSGVEKIVINSAAIKSTRIIREVSESFGSQCIGVAIDVKRSLLGNYKVMTRSATIDTGLDLEKHLYNVQEAGAGEVLINSVDRDGTMAGYDLDLLRFAKSHLHVPVVASGGAGTLDHLKEAIVQGGASAAAAGSMFVFHGRHRAVLINYPDPRSRNFCEDL